MQLVSEAKIVVRKASPGDEPTVCVEGTLKNHAGRIASFMRSLPVEAGTVRVRGGRLVFSASFDASVRQRVRNFLYTECRLKNQSSGPLPTIRLSALGVGALAVVVLGALLIQGGHSCSTRARSNASISRDVSALSDDAPEALAWLKSNRNKSALASNRFGPTEEAVAFVRRLYELGARRVVIPPDILRDEPDRIRTEGGPYADALVVFLPSDGASREGLTAFCRTQARADEAIITGDDAILLWWD